MTTTTTAPDTIPCAKCGKPAAFTVGWLAPTRRDAFTETADTRGACSEKCAYALAYGATK